MDLFALGPEINMKMLRCLAPALAWFCCAAGCAGFQTEMLESELREREDEALLVRAHAQDLQFQLAGCRRENNVLRSQLRDSGTKGMLPEQAAALFSLNKITLNRLVTGGVDTDGRPGDDALRVVLEPRDQRGDLIKSPGTITIELVDLALDPADRRVGYWTFDLETALKHWRGGLFGTGYHFKLPWQRGFPRHQDLSLHARLLTPDGRAFRVTKSLTVRLTPGNVPERVHSDSAATRATPPANFEASSGSQPLAAPPKRRPSADPNPVNLETPPSIPSPADGAALPVVVPPNGTSHRRAAPAPGNRLERAPFSGTGWRPVPKKSSGGPVLNGPGGSK